MDQPHFPNDGLTKAFLQEDFNGFGFQSTALRKPGTIAIARVSEDGPADAERVVRSKTGSKTLKIVDFLGNNFVTIHYSEWGLIPAVFQECVFAGHTWISPNIHNLKPASSFSGKQFSFEEAERQTVEKFKDTMEMFKDHGSNPWAFTFELLGSPKPMRRLYNYRTKEGQMFCIQLNANIGKPFTAEASQLQVSPWWHNLPEVDAACREAGVLHYAEWSKREVVKAPETPVSNEPPAKRVKTADDEEHTMCVVCMERVANTIALPCEHIVVCDLCSVQLAQTHFAHNCVMCRGNVSEVLKDENE